MREDDWRGQLGNDRVWRKHRLYDDGSVRWLGIGRDDDG